MNWKEEACLSIEKCIRMRKGHHTHSPILLAQMLFHFRAYSYLSRRLLHPNCDCRSYSPGITYRYRCKGNALHIHRASGKNFESELRRRCIFIHFSWNSFLKSPEHTIYIRFFQSNLAWWLCDTTYQPHSSRFLRRTKIDMYYGTDAVVCETTDITYNLIGSCGVCQPVHVFFSLPALHWWRKGRKEMKNESRWGKEIENECNKNELNTEGGKEWQKRRELRNNTERKKWLRKDENK